MRAADAEERARGAAAVLGAEFGGAASGLAAAGRLSGATGCAGSSCISRIVNTEQEHAGEFLKATGTH